MHYRIRLTASSLAVAAAFAAVLPLEASAAPTVSFRAPSSGRTVSGTLSGAACEVTGLRIYRMRYFLDSTELASDSSSPWNCTLDTRRFSNGTHTLRAVAYDTGGGTASTSISVNIQNSTTSTPTTGTLPTIAFQMPAEGGALKGNVQGPPNCTVTGSNIARVMFYINDVWTNTDGKLTNGLGCWIDTTKYKDGAYTLKAVAYNAAGQTATATRAITIQNTVAAPAPAPTPTNGAPTVSFTAPAAGGVLKGNVQGPPNCIVQGSNIARVMFYINDVWTNTDGNLTNGLGCWIDTTKYKDGAYTLKAVAYNAAGQTATVTHPITIQNGASTPTPTPTTNKAPTVAFMAPASGATITGQINSTTCAVNAADDKAVSKVDFYVGKTLVSSKTAAPWQCAIDTTKFSNGTQTLMAVAFDAEGLSATAQRDVNVQNTSTTTPAPTPTDGTGGVLEAADIIGWASGNTLFTQQKGYSSQVLGTHTSVTSIPEAGIHGSTLPNGETLRMGKETDPLNSAKKVLSFQLAYSDPNTSGSKRSEISFSPNVEMNKVYWVAFRAYVRDWGNESSGGLYGTQLHSGDNSRGLSPSFGIYMSGARNFRVETRYSTSSSPTPSNSITVKHADQPIKFGQWQDFVIKFKHNTSGQGFLQAWVDGQQIVDYKGNLGFNTPNYKDYFKFGLYNWASFSGGRKVMLHSPTMVLDPTGSKYDAAALRAHVNK